MRCQNCKLEDEGLRRFCGKVYCHSCLMTYIQEELLEDAIEFYIKQNSEEIEGKMEGD